MVIIRIIKCLNFKAKQFYKIVIYMFKIVDYLFEQQIDSIGYIIYLSLVIVI